MVAFLSPFRVTAAAKKRCREEVKGQQPADVTLLFTSTFFSYSRPKKIIIIIINPNPDLHPLHTKLLNCSCKLNSLFSTVNEDCVLNSQTFWGSAPVGIIIGIQKHNGANTGDATEPP